MIIQEPITIDLKKISPSTRFLLPTGEEMCGEIDTGHGYIRFAGHGWKKICWLRGHVYGVAIHYEHNIAKIIEEMEYPIESTIKYFMLEPVEIKIIK